MYHLKRAMYVETLSPPFRWLMLGFRSAYMYRTTRATVDVAFDVTFWSK